MELSIFSTNLKAAFARGQQSVATPAPIKSFTSVLSSTQRIETYPWFTPAPGMAEYAGARRYAQRSNILYSIPNIEYDKGFTVLLRDIEDNQVSGYDQMMASYSEEAGEPFQSRLVLQQLAAGTSRKCFDGTNFFATTHNQGGGSTTAAAPGVTFTGGNTFSYSVPGGSDGTSHRFCLLVKNPTLQPLVLQKRKAPKFGTNSGSVNAQEDKEVRYWVDAEYGAGFGYWWDAINCTITHTPAVTDLWACLDFAMVILRQFTLPKALSSDPTQYVHEQLTLGKDKVALVVSAGLSQLMRYAVLQPSFGIGVGGTGFKPNSLYMDAFEVITSNHLNP